MRSSHLTVGLTLIINHFIESMKHCRFPPPSNSGIFRVEYSVVSHEFVLLQSPAGTLDKVFLENLPSQSFGF